MSTKLVCDLCGKDTFPVNETYILKRKVRFFDSMGHGEVTETVDAHEKCREKLFKATGK